MSSFFFYFLNCVIYLLAYNNTYITHVQFPQLQLSQTLQTLFEFLKIINSFSIQLHISFEKPFEEFLQHQTLNNTKAHLIKKMLISTAIFAAVLAIRVYAAPFFQSASSNVDCFTSGNCFHFGKTPNVHFVSSYLSNIIWMFKSDT